jgi:HrpA-like RNA helicase
MRHEVPSAVEPNVTLPTSGERLAVAETPELVLPITEHMPAIVNMVENNRISILVAETGAGKTTQVPKGLERAGFKVSVTQPRRMAARMIAARIAEELAIELGDEEHNLVGIHTAATNTVTPATRVEVATDGLRLQQEFHNARTELTKEVLAIDEVHEKNANIDVLVALMADIIAERPNLRILLMSATINSPAHADEIEALTGVRPPIMEVAGRTFGVERREEPNSHGLLQAIKVAKDNLNPIVVLPGVGEIKDMKDDLKRHFASIGRTDVTILPLHGKLSDAHQNAAARSYPGLKVILATKLIQTSMTFTDADVVIDCGKSRRIEIDEEGSESLRLYDVSQADCSQRAGRVGRTHPGLYILTRLNEDTEFVPFNERDKYPTPEILLSNIDRLVLALTCRNKTLEDLKLPVDSEVVARACRSLHLLGAFDDQGNVTPRGRHMNKFPVHPTSARMLVEAENYSDEVQAYVAAVTAAMEVGKLPSYLHTANKKWRELTEETSSDHLAQLDIFIATQTHLRPELAELGLDIRNVELARELHDKIIRRAGTRPQELLPPTAIQRDEILECVTAGLVDFVYEKSGRNEYNRVKGVKSVTRQISNRSVGRHSRPKLAVGVPYNYEHAKKGEMHVLDSVSPTTAATPGRVAAQLCTWEVTGTQWRAGQPVHEQRQMFRGELPTGTWREIPAEPSPTLRADIIDYVTRNPGQGIQRLCAIKKELEHLNRLAQRDVPQLSEDYIKALIERVTPGDITDPGHLNELIRQAVEGVSLDTFINATARDAIHHNSPDFLELPGKDMKLHYSNGQVTARIAHLREVEALTDEIHLPDGRHVQLVYEKKQYALDQLKEMSRK